MNDWTPAKGWEGVYEVTRAGAVRSVSRIVRSRYNSTRRIKGKVLTLSIHRGYQALCIRIDGARRNLLVHRMVAETFIPNPDGKPFVNHLDGDRANNHVANLEWCTHAENMRHAFDTGLAPLPKSGPGEASPAAKLCNNDVAQIKKALLQGASQARLARQYGVANGTIGFIAKGETWTHIEPAP